MKYLLISLILASNLAHSACETSQYQEFDFWLGQWEVNSASSKQTSHNTITKINNGCGLLEEYTTAKGYQGKSLNIFDVQIQLFYHTWIDNTGYLLRLSGSMEGSSMVMSGETRGKKDKLILNRITWTPIQNGDVRQHWQISNDNGKTWETAFDGLYHKVSY